MFVFCWLPVYSQFCFHYKTNHCLEFLFSSIQLVIHGLLYAAIMCHHPYISVSLSHVKCLSASFFWFAGPTCQYQIYCSFPVWAYKRKWAASWHKQRLIQNLNPGLLKHIIQRNTGIYFTLSEYSSSYYETKFHRTNTEILGCLICVSPRCKIKYYKSQITKCPF